MRRSGSNSSYPVPTSETDRSEELSIAYVSAIAAHAGIKCEITGRKDHGTDMTFKRLRKRRIDNRYNDMDGISIPCQVKSARYPQWEENEKKGIISYNLQAKNYNDIVNSTHGFLVLMCLPATLDQWLQQDHTCLRLYKCCYYWIPGPDDEETENSSTKTIYIPRTQLFSVERLVSIVDDAQIYVNTAGDARTGMEL